MENQHLERQKLVAEIWKTRLSSLAIVVGGIWALFLFCALREAYLAQAKVAEIEAKNVALELALKPNQVKGDFWEIVLEIRNKGILPIDVNLKGGEVFTLVKIDKVVSTEQVDVSGGQSLNAHNLITPRTLRSISSATVFPGSTTQVHYLVELPDDGVYFASFISEISPDVLALINKQERGDLEEKNTHGSAWMAQKYFAVGAES